MLTSYVWTLSQAALELYLKALIALPVKNKDEIVAFFTSDVVREAQKPVSQAGYKEGYLTKRGKNFGGWKTRYFVLQGPSLEYYESVSILYPAVSSHHTFFFLFSLRVPNMLENLPGLLN